MESEYRKNKIQAAEGAIRTWQEWAKGIYHWSEKQRYSKEYCLTQVEYFKEILKEIKKTKK